MLETSKRSCPRQVAALLTTQNWLFHAALQISARSELSLLEVDRAAGEN
jgi:hypothetical protein